MPKDVFKQRYKEQEPLEDKKTIHQSDIPAGGIKFRHTEGEMAKFGLATDRPSGSTHVKAYYSTDTDILELWDGDSWQEVGGSGSTYIDISDNTNLAVTAPIVLTDDTVSISLNASHLEESGGSLQLITNGIDDTLIDWGTGANQVSAVDLPIADVGSVITATEVEGALQENRTAIDLNTTHRSSDGTDHTYIDQDLQTSASPTFNDLTISVPSNIYALSHDSFADYASGEHFTMLDEDDMASDSATQAATQQSVKTYVDAEAVPNAIKWAILL